MNNQEINKEELAEKAKAYIQEQQAQEETPTKEGWLKLLKDDFVGGWDEMVETFEDTWNSVSKMTDTIFGQNKDVEKE